MFSGSYLKEDVTFLLKVIDIPFTSIEQKERLIQSKVSHYSEMLSAEYEPSQAYLEVFYQAFARNGIRFARDILVMAEHISHKKRSVLVSLVRAGTPIGVLIGRTLRAKFGLEVPHYSISIIRDREIDNVALRYIVENHPKSEIVFIDGWTGKGVISRELKTFIAKFNRENHTTLSDHLYVVSDIAGMADFAVTNEDYLIPSSSLNSTISGLVSRSVLNRDYIATGEFHGCLYYQEYAKSDLSLWFVDEVMKMIDLIEPTGQSLIQKHHNKNAIIDEFFISLGQKYNIEDINYIKPGIGESTRVLLRRVPHLILVQDIHSEEIAHLILLAREKNVKIEEDPTLPFCALAIIKEVER